MAVPFRNAADLPLVNGDFAAAAGEARRRAKYLLVYLHSPWHPDCAEFVDRVLTDPLVVLMLKTDFLLWAADVSTKGGYEVMWSLGATCFPFVLMQIKSDVVLRLQGTFSAVTFMVQLQKAMDAAAHVRAEEITWMTDREERERMRQMHEQELAEATRVDQARQEAARRQREADAKAAAEAEAARQAAAREELEAQRQREQALEAQRLEAEQKAKQLEQRRELARSQLPEEATSIEGVPADQISQIRLICLNGAARERRFPSSAPVDWIYAFAESQPEFDNRAYYCTSGFPPRRLPRGDGTTIGDHKMLLGRAVVTMREELSPKLSPASPF